VKGIVDLFVNDSNDVTSSISNSICTVLSSIMGSNFGTESKRILYYVAVEGVSMVRVDIGIWYKKVSA
jgi:hypothetical protein